MRFLVDENLPRRFAAVLRAAGHDATHVAEQQFPSVVSFVISVADPMTSRASSS